MYDRILIPTDGSEGSIRAVNRGLGVAKSFDADVHVLYVVDSRLFGGMDLADEEELERTARGSGRQAITVVRERAAELGLEITQRVTVGVPHADIMEYVESNDIDLVAMGTHGRIGADLAALGSTTERVLQRADVPVLTVRLSGELDQGRGSFDAEVDDILVPTDGSDASMRAAEHAIGFADQYGATLHALYVVDTSIFEFEDAPRSILGTLRDGGEDAVSEIDSLASDAAISATVSIDEGNPAELILGYADDIDAELLALGRRGRTGLPEVLLGSTIARVVRVSETPVLSVT